MLRVDIFMISFFGDRYAQAEIVEDFGELLSVLHPKLRLLLIFHVREPHYVAFSVHKCHITDLQLESLLDVQV